MGLLAGDRPRVYLPPCLLKYCVPANRGSFAVDKSTAIISLDLNISIVTPKENLEVIPVYKLMVGSQDKQTENF